MIWPEKIRLLSLPSMVAASLLVWTGLLYLGFFLFLPSENPLRKTYLYFGLTSLTFALYAFGSMNSFSTDRPEGVYYWGVVQFAAIVPLAIFFIRFSVSHLDLDNFYFRWVMPLVTIAFLPFFFIDDLMLNHVFYTVHFYFMGKSTHFLQPGLGPVSYPFIAWCFANTFYVGYLWLRHLLRKPEDLLLWGAFVLFLGTAVNDTLVSFRLYDFMHLFVYGFAGFLLAMGFQLFSDYFEVNRQVIKKTRELETINEEMRFLVSIISHDFMGPLISIRGFVDILKEREAQEEGKRQHYLSRIAANTDHMRELLKDLAIYLQIGRLEEEITSVDMNLVVHEALAMLDTASLHPKVKVELPEEWPKFHGSPKRLKQILLNLVHNSLKYAGKEELRITIRAKEEGEGILFSIEDNGVGIPRHLHQKVFEIFFRNHPHIPGTGLGLSIIKKIVESFGGKVWVDPDYQEGACIKFFLPFPSRKERRENYGGL